LWSVSVTVFQILPEGVLVVLTEAGGTEQTEDEGEEEAVVDPRLAQSVPRAAVHMHDPGAVCASARAGSPLQR